MTDTMAWPPDAHAFSTASIGLPPRPGTIATSPDSRPCWLSEKLQTAPIAATSTEAGSAVTLPHVSVTARDTMSGTETSPSLPNGDWW